MVPGNYHIDLPGNSNIRCTKPDRKMIDDPRGIYAGWFIYPFYFDPVFMRKECENFSPNGGSEAKNTSRASVGSPLC
jgi:hypothetical protein